MKPEAENKRDGKTERAYAKVMKEDNRKYKVALSFKLAFNIKKPTNLKHVLEFRILDSDVEFKLREVVGIVKEFHKVIIDMIRRKRQVVDCATIGEDFKAKKFRKIEKELQG